MKTLLIVSHPYPDQSQAVRSLQQAAEPLPNLLVRNLESLYGHDTRAIDVAAEQAAHDNVDRVVYLFPIHWFNLTPMLKAYLNQVWTYGWAFGPEGKALQGKEMQVVVTAGASAHTYSAEGLIQSRIQEILTPMKASALYVGMHYAEPLAFYEAMGAQGDRLAGFRDALRARLSAPLSPSLVA
ncbi:NAD(P)H-dependent oxidoreductase [Curvibacter sp. HBC61]|uniref:NAD(P)H-dependent oxidoreductase n=1 Tax=Curvibacter cyanobacteriorum TaxID=3026422 RepID=A0ABT5N0M4_9BURK|nr:NAD(P)H-dependent oxidoreductase [Curvibacter sp. HBC61]MDD0839864.1 NAD(P)H-dependent oxidoreductase [Curvibacter sp. HBC61]